jgi:hypothetical protein
VIKELRLAEVSTLDAANAFLKSYLPIYNRRFAVRPAQAADLHRPRPARGELDRILCIKTTRVLRRDWTVAHNGYLYQVQTNVRATQVVIEERVDGTLRITHHASGSRARLCPHRRTSGTSGSTAAGVPPAPAGHTGADSSMAQTGAASTRTPGGGAHHINRTFLLWEKEDISKLG